MLYNEDDIREKLNKHSVEIDTNQLWNDVKGHAPIKQKRNWWPLLYVLGGVIIGMLLNNVNFNHSSPKKENNNAYIIDSLSNQIVKLQDLNESINSHLLQIEKTCNEEQQNLKNELLAMNTRRTMGIKESFNNSFENKIALQTKDVSTSIISDFNNDNKKEIESLSAINLDKDENKILLLDPLSTRPPYLTMMKKPNVELPIVSESIKPIKNHKDWQYSLSVAVGLPFISDKVTNNENGKEKNIFNPFPSYIVDFTTTRKISPRWRLGGSISYNNFSYSLDYTKKVVEDIDVIDTTEIIIGQSGNINASVGNVGGYKIVEKNGKVHGYSHRLSLIPTAYFTSYHTSKWKLSHHLGAGLDFFTNSRNLYQTNDENKFVTINSNEIKLNPFLRVGSSIDFTYLKDHQASLMLQCSFRKESHTYLSNTANRSIILPSLGLGFTL